MKKEIDQEIRWVFKSFNKDCSYSDNILRFKTESLDVRIIEISPGTRNRASFFSQISFLVPFPSYFGRNFAALNDCLNDGDVINDSSVVLFIRESDTFLIDEPDSFIEGLIDTLNHVGRSWLEGGIWPWEFMPRRFITVFDMEIVDDRYKNLPLFDLV